jgi:hypothetical protein
MDFSIIFEHSRKGVKVQKKNYIPEFVPTMKQQIGSFSIVRATSHSLAPRPQRNTEHRRMAGAKEASNINY